MTEIQFFDPHAASPREWADYNAFRRLRAEEDEPGEAVTGDAEFKRDTRTHRPLHETLRWIAPRDGEIVGSFGIWCRREGTPDHETYKPFMYVWGGVRRPWRRQGVATALLRQMLAFMDERGKTIATMGTHLADGRAFLEAVGAVEKNRSIINRLSFAGLDWEELARWQAAATPAGSPLTWEIHAGRVPPDRLAHLHPQFTNLFRDVPMGSLDLPPIRYEMQTYLSWYEEMDQHGGEHLLVLLMDGDQVAGMSEANWSPRFPDRVYQELTAVARPWRGRGLGKALKAAMLRLARDRLPEARLMSTQNAEANASILAINRRLGFVAYRRDSSYQIGRDALAAWLASRDQRHGPTAHADPPVRHRPAQGGA